MHIPIPLDVRLLLAASPRHGRLVCYSSGSVGSRKPRRETCRRQVVSEYNPAGRRRHCLVVAFRLSQVVDRDTQALLEPFALPDQRCESVSRATASWSMYTPRFSDLLISSIFDTKYMHQTSFEVRNWNLGRLKVLLQLRISCVVSVRTGIPPLGSLLYHDDRRRAAYWAYGGEKPGLLCTCFKPQGDCLRGHDGLDLKRIRREDAISGELHSRVLCSRHPPTAYSSQTGLPSVRSDLQTTADVAPCTKHRTALDC